MMASMEWHCVRNHERSFDTTSQRHRRAASDSDVQVRPSMKCTKAPISASVWSCVRPTFASNGESFSHRISTIDAPRNRCLNARNSLRTSTRGGERWLRRGSLPREAVMAVLDPYLGCQEYYFPTSN